MATLHFHQVVLKKKKRRRERAGQGWGCFQGGRGGVEGCSALFCSVRGLLLLITL